TAEARSEHHLATAILQHAETEGIRPGQADSWALHPGLGVEAHAGGEEILVGNLRLMESRGVEIGEEQRRAAAGREARGDALAYVAVGRRMIGLIAIHDPVRPEAAEMIARL